VWWTARSCGGVLGRPIWSRVPRLLCKCFLGSAFCLSSALSGQYRHIANPGRPKGGGGGYARRVRTARMSQKAAAPDVPARLEYITLCVGSRTKLASTSGYPVPGPARLERGETEDLGDELLQQFCGGAQAAVTVRSRTARDGPRAVCCNRVLFLEKGRASK
jgi:hypothetical protein